MSKKLFCFPYAGGSAFSIYSRWKGPLLESGVEVVPVEMAGRGSRMGDEFYRSIDDAVDSFLDIVENGSENNDYALWGHSMGAIIVYELAKKLKEKNIKSPQFLLVSGRKPLHIQEDKTAPLYLKPDQEFIEEIISMNGTDPKAFADKSLRDLFLPILKDDFRLLHDYQGIKGKDHVDVPIVAMKGSEETFDELEYSKWQDLTSAECDILTLEGDHFFINDNLESITEIITDKMMYGGS